MKWVATYALIIQQDHECHGGDILTFSNILTGNDYVRMFHFIYRNNNNDINNNNNNSNNNSNYNHYKNAGDDDDYHTENHDNNKDDDDNDKNDYNNKNDDNDVNNNNNNDDDDDDKKNNDNVSTNNNDHEDNINDSGESKTRATCIMGLRKRLQLLSKHLPHLINSVSSVGQSCHVVDGPD